MKREEGGRERKKRVLDAFDSDRKEEEEREEKRRRRRLLVLLSVDSHGRREQVEGVSFWARIREGGGALMAGLEWGLHGLEDMTSHESSADDDERERDRLAVSPYLPSEVELGSEVVTSRTRGEAPSHC